MARSSILWGTLGLWANGFLGPRPRGRPCLSFWPAKNTPFPGRFCDNYVTGGHSKRTGPWGQTAPDGAGAASVAPCLKVTELPKAAVFRHCPLAAEDSALFCRQNSVKHCAGLGRAPVGSSRCRGATTSTTSHDWTSPASSWCGWRLKISPGRGYGVLVWVFLLPRGPK